METWFSCGQFTAIGGGEKTEKTGVDFATGKTGQKEANKIIVDIHEKRRLAFDGTVKKFAGGMRPFLARGKR
ncbi:MAG: hypothetical protein D6762_00410 [Candidatus Neomarinimicrobiota bacterium]|nr:MAG: hypothetical protein D6762_00410 [Candidatus Neomarinimicrobiota bacterium]